MQNVGFNMEPSNKSSSANPALKRGGSLTPDETRTICAFIKKLCKRLKFKSNVMCSALVFFHRFHSRHIPGGGGPPYEEYDLATACVFLACKVEENIQKLERILDVAHNLRTGDPKPLSQNAEQMWKKREKTLVCERILLDTISFNVVVEHAHFHANRFSLQVTNGDKAEARALHQIASNILNDSLSTNLCLKYSPALIGAAAVRLAGRVLRDQSSSPHVCSQKLEELERSGEMFGEPLSRVLKVEDELISTYDVAGGGSLESTDAGKRVKMVTPPPGGDDMDQ